MTNKAISASFVCLALLSACSRQFIVAAPVPDEVATIRIITAARNVEIPLEAWFRTGDGVRHAILPLEADGAPVRVEAVGGDGCVLAAGATGGGPDVQLLRVEHCGDGLPQPPPDLGAVNLPDLAYPETTDMSAPELPDLAGPPPPDMAPRRVMLSPAGLHRIAQPAPGVYKVAPGFDFATQKADPAVFTFPLPVSDRRQVFSLEITGTLKWEAPSTTIYCDAAEGQYTIRSNDNKFGYCPFAFWEARIAPASSAPDAGGALISASWSCAARDLRGVCTSPVWPELRNTPPNQRPAVPAGKAYEIRLVVQGAVEIGALYVSVHP